MITLSQNRCPYCGSQVSIDSLGCCGESNAHFELFFELEDGQAYPESELEIEEDDPTSYYYRRKA